MNLKIKYFGLITEVTECSEEQFEFSGRLVSELRNALYKKYPELKNKDFKMAQDNTLMINETEVSGKEIALLPPFAGG